MSLVYLGAILLAALGVGAIDAPSWAATAAMSPVVIVATWTGSTRPTRSSGTSGTWSRA